MSTSAQHDEYVNNVLAKYKVPAPIPQIKQNLEAIVRNWVGPNLLSMNYSGSFAKLTAVRGESDIDFFISLATTTPLEDIYQGLFDFLSGHRLNPRKQNVSVHIKYLGAEVDLTPGRLQFGGSGDHSLYVNRRRTWTKTNVAKHISIVRGSGRWSEIRALKIWRNCHRLEFPSIYLELMTIDALRGRQQGTQLAQNFVDTLAYLANNIATARIADPANTNNIISDDLTQAEKQAVASKGNESLTRPWWQVIW